MPRHYRVTTMPQASSDLENIFEYILQDSPQNAASVLESLLGAIASLSQFPHRYKVHRSARNPGRIIRSMPVPPYVVYYRLIESEQNVQVLTIRHGARRPPRQL